MRDFRPFWRDFHAKSAWSLYTRYVLRSYLRRTLIVLVALLGIAFTVDLVPQISTVVATSSLDGPSSAITLLYFVVLRSADLVPRFLCLSAFLGVLWGEIDHTVSRERILISNSGLSQFSRLVPALWLGAMLGPIQYALDVSVRPAAMHLQIEKHLGTYGKEFDRRLSPEQHWLNAGSDVVRTRIDFNSDYMLRDLTVYMRDASGQIREIDKARLGRSLGNGYWNLRDGSYLQFSIAADGGKHFRQAVAPAAASFSERIIKLPVSSDWLRVWGIYPEYLSQTYLIGLSAAHIEPAWSRLFETRVYVNEADLFLPGLMSALAAILCQKWLEYRIVWRGVFTVLLIGYASTFVGRAMTLMGEHSYASPFWAGWLLSILLATLILCLLGRSVLLSRQKHGAT